MKELICLRNVRMVRYVKGNGFEFINVFYSDTNEYLEYCYDTTLNENKDKCYKTYVKIKNALTNKEDFVEVEL
jgi:urate oxidase